MCFLFVMCWPHLVGRIAIASSTSQLVEPIIPLFFFVCPLSISHEIQPLIIDAALSSSFSIAFFNHNCQFYSVLAKISRNVLELALVGTECPSKSFQPQIRFQFRTNSAPISPKVLYFHSYVAKNYKIINCKV